MHYIIKKLKGLKYLLFQSSEEKESEKKRLAFYGRFISNNDLVFDVGANMGNRVKIFLQLGAKVVAVEPQKKCYTFLKRKFGEKIFIVAKGAGEKEDKKPFYVADVSVLSTFSENFITETQKSGRFAKYNWKKAEYIDITTLDLIIKEYGVPKFIKIDVEGYELEVLKGLSLPINYISFEYALPEQKDKTIECIKRISEITGNNSLFNYSTGESMEFALKEWISTDKMLDLAGSKIFEDTGFGDIYAQSQDNL